MSIATAIKKTKAEQYEIYRTELETKRYNTYYDSLSFDQITKILDVLSIESLHHFEDRKINDYLYKAIECNNTEVFELLLPHPDVNINKKYVFLHKAAQLHNIKIAKLLIEKGIDVNKVDKIKGNTALFRLLESDCAIPMIKLLLENGAKVALGNGKFALHRAVYTSYKNIEIHKMIIEHDKTVINAKDNNGYTVLYWAVLKKRMKLVELFLTYGADANVHIDADSTLTTPFHTAVKYGPVEMVALLLNNNADIHSLVRHKTPLHIAVNGYNIYEIIELLLQHDRTIVDVGDNENNTALHMAVRQRDVNITKLLIKYGANVNMQESDGGHTPLHMAVSKGYMDIMELLLNAGADPYIKTYKGKTCFDVDINGMLRNFYKINKQSDKRSNTKQSDTKRSDKRSDKVCIIT